MAFEFRERKKKKTKFRGWVAAEVLRQAYLGNHYQFDDNRLHILPNMLHSETILQEPIL